MTRRSPIPWLPWLLGGLALLVLVVTVPHSAAALQTDPPIDLRIGIVLTGIVAFVVNVEVPLQGEVISLGYPAGLLVYLIFGRNTFIFGVLLITIIGGISGGILRLWRRERRLRFNREVVNEALIAGAQLPLSLILGHQAYLWLGGHLPLSGLDWDDLLPLLGVIIVSGTIYLGLYALTLRWRNLAPRAFFQQNSISIALAMIIPLPLVIAAALIYDPQALGGFAMLGAGLLALSIWATDVGRGRLRFRHQFIELQSLSAVNQALKTQLDMPSLLQAIYLQVAALIKFSDFTLTLYDATQNIFTFPLIMRNGTRAADQAQPFGQGLIVYIIQNKGSLLLTDDLSSSRFNRHYQDDMPYDAIALHYLSGSRFNSWLGVPLIASNRVLGCISIALDDPILRFTEREQRLLSTIAVQSGVAIENAQLFEQARQRATQLSQLNLMSARLSGTLDPQRVFEVVVESMMIIASATGAALFLWWDDARTSLALVRSVGLSKGFANDAPLPLSAAANLVDSKVLAVSNVETDSRATTLSQVMLAEGFRAWVELPLRNGLDVLGVLIAYYPVPRQFSSDELELLQAFANQAALSISNARLYGQVDEALERRVDQLSALAEINRELASLFNLDKLFNLVLDRAIEATRSNGGVLLLRQETRDEPRIVARRTDTPTNTGELIALDAYTQASKLAQPIVERDSHLSHLSNGMLARVSVPIVRDYDVLGVIMLETRSNNAYPAEDVAFVKQLAAQAAIAIENVRMFEWMQDNRDRLQVILDSMHEGVIMFGTDGRISLANPRVEQLLNMNSALLVGERFQNLIARPELIFAERLGFEKDSLGLLFDRLSGSLSLDGLGIGIRFSYRLEQPQTRFIDRTIVPVYNHLQRLVGVLMVFSDATEERELAQAREDLTRMIVHDLRGPLTAVNASMRLLGEIAPPGNSMGDSIRRTTDVSQRAVRKLLNLINSLLDIAKMESGNLALDTQIMGLRPTAESVKLELSPLADELSIQMDVTIPNDLPLLRVDEDKIERVLLNLVDNALKFAPVEGYIEIRARRENDEFVRVEVVDNGPGIPDKSKIRIFDRFQQIENGKSHRRGTGLGLTFCKLVIEAHGGRIWIEDNPTGGSVFAFTLPTVVTSNSD